MMNLPLVFRDGHIFIELEGDLWLLDTGAPKSFGTNCNPAIAGEELTLSKSYLGLTAETLSEFVGVPCVGLLGADVLGRFDQIIDISGGQFTISTTELTHDGRLVPLDEFMGIPIVSAQIGGNDYRMFFDTGAKVSYFQDSDLLAEYPPAGNLTDFFPGIGQFQTETCQLELTLGDMVFTLRCGQLPGLLGASLLMADAQGIIGNQLLINRRVGFFPRRNALYL